MKKTLVNYYAPTPKRWRKIGDALLAVSTFVTASTISSNHYVAYGSLSIGVVGKFLTNFFTDDESKATENSKPE